MTTWTRATSTLLLSACVAATACGDSSSSTTASTAGETEAGTK